jgi:nicotinate dehydrogenase subunit A
MRVLPERRDPHGEGALDANPKATDAQVRQALSNVLCRCGTHTRMLKAIKRYAQEVRA